MQNFAEPDDGLLAFEDDEFLHELTTMSSLREFLERFATDAFPNSFLILLQILDRLAATGKRLVSLPQFVAMERISRISYLDLQDGAGTLWADYCTWGSLADKFELIAAKGVPRTSPVPTLVRLRTDSWKSAAPSFPPDTCRRTRRLCRADSYVACRAQSCSAACGKHCSAARQLASPVRRQQAAAIPPADR